MLTIEIPTDDGGYDETTQSFVALNTMSVDLEHSLVSLSKWESFFEKPFLGPGEKTQDELFYYIRCMALTPDVPLEVFAKLTKGNVDAIEKHINAKMTATYVYEPKTGPLQETITAELIYYWMIHYQIPFECQYWHLNRLLTLVKVCNRKNSPEKKMSQRELAEWNRSENARRRQEMNSKG